MASVREGVVLAGGRGSRLGGLTEFTPKPLMQVGGRPFLSYVLAELEAAGVERIFLSVGYLADKIEAYFGPRFGDVVLEYVHETAPLGTGGATLECLRRSNESRLVVSNGDTYLAPFPKEFITSSTAQSHPLLVVSSSHLVPGADLVWLEEDRCYFGTDGNTPQSVRPHSNAGLYVLGEQDFEGTSLSGKFSLEKDFLPDFSRKNTLKYEVHLGELIDIGTPQSLGRLRNFLSAGSGQV